MHASLLQQKDLKVDGLDSSREMLDIARTRVHSNLYQQNILDIHINHEYNVIISMFAVLNHLKSTTELQKSLLNLQKILSTSGRIIIDLHNPQNSSKKHDSFGNISRTMEWYLDKKSKIENSKITFEINGKRYVDSHTFRIFTIKEVEQCCKNVGLAVKKVYENYDINKCGSPTSKNLQFLICKA